MTRKVVLALVLLGLGMLTLTIINTFQQINAQVENETFNTYQNGEYGFAFQYPANWQISNSGVSTLFEKQVIAFEAPERRLTPDGEREVAETTFSVYASNVSSYLDPSDLQVKSQTAEDYARDEFSFMLEPSSYGMSFEFGKNTSVPFAGQNDSWRIDHITSLDGEQRTFAITIFTVVDDVAFRLDFVTNPLKVPEMAPIFEKIQQSFRFI